MASKIYLTLLITSGLTLAVPTSSAITGPTSAHVTNQEAFTSGAGNKNPDPSLSPGVAGSDKYTCYTGGWWNYPGKSEWVSFTNMFKNNRAMMKSGCADLKLEGNSNDQIDYVRNAIIEVSKASLVDPRFILAIIMQESFGCVHVGTTDNGVRNPGIMQSHNGASFIGNAASAGEQQASVTTMVVNGVQGTSNGDGLVQLINKYGNIYEAARRYNSGAVDAKNLNNKMGATASYVVDIANRMTGWVSAPSEHCS